MAINEAQPNDGAGTEDERGKQSGRGFEGVFRRFTADPAMAMLTLGLLIFAGWQVHLSRDTARRQLRAYIIVREMRVTLEATGSQDNARIDSGALRAVITGSNCGGTPAKVVCAGAEIVLAVDSEAHKIAPLILDGKHSTDWGTGDGPPLTAMGNLDADQMRRLMSGKSRVFINGAFEYEDIFRRRHHTRFRYTIDIERADTLPQAYAHTEGNEAT